MNDTSKNTKDKKGYSLAGVVSLPGIARRYAIIANNDDMYTTSLTLYNKKGAEALCHDGSWLCSTIKVLKRSDDENEIESVLIAWNDSYTQKGVSKEFILSRGWYRDMMSQGIGVTAHPYKRRILLAWLRRQEDKG
ncbi:hypothetical protein HGO23_19265 [Xenorhabdus budapestensis]|uniref:Uncharacterized protein n=1 Tax=Xenorhabdus budapestensis TaxID=290110 RepID=A0ABX7VGI6_XENBU|nr:hypothetical protein [Xenorhabdus budapestensis]QTL39849.1 hypothetical protein HGO23_19265 [Xenorhabdus budapestensis]